MKLAEVDTFTTPQLDKILSDAMEYQSFHSLETEYQQNKYFVEKLNLLVRLLL